MRKNLLHNFKGGIRMCMTMGTEEKSVKRDYKSRMFTMIFKDKKELLHLYNAVGQRLFKFLRRNLLCFTTVRKSGPSGK